MRELEKGAVLSAQLRAEEDVGVSAPMTRYMMRSVACFQQQGVAFVDTQPATWQALHCNLALSDVRLASTIASRSSPVTICHAACSAGVANQAGEPACLLSQWAMQQSDCQSSCNKRIGTTSCQLLYAWD